MTDVFSPAVLLLVVPTSQVDLCVNCGCVLRVVLPDHRSRRSFLSSFPRLVLAISLSFFLRLFLPSRASPVASSFLAYGAGAIYVTGNFIVSEGGVGIARWRWRAAATTGAKAVSRAGGIKVSRYPRILKARQDTYTRIGKNGRCRSDGMTHACFSLFSFLLSRLVSHEALICKLRRHADVHAPQCRRGRCVRFGHSRDLS